MCMSLLVRVVSVFFLLGGLFNMVLVVHVMHFESNHVNHDNVLTTHDPKVNSKVLTYNRRANSSIRPATTTKSGHVSKKVTAPSGPHHKTA